MPHKDDKEVMSGMVDALIGAASNQSLDRANKDFNLGLKRIKHFWLFNESDESFRKRVRVALKAKWQAEVAMAKAAAR